MGNWSWSGILLIFGLFLFIFGFVLAQIQVENPLQGNESSILEWVKDLVVDALTPSWWPF